MPQMMLISVVFAGTGAEQREDLAAANLEIDAAERA
jgi:hypothetical protein